ncbi:MAG: acetate kinase [Cyanobacteria bacterium 13_1_40CM_2_61_4]|nr:MAG: acetate kinase [Cyanobacteria bacterium 13_1_40CM_2_61_4]
MHSVLTINSGSSSLRFALFNALEALPQILIGKFERIGLSDARLSFTDSLSKQRDERMIDAPNHVACVPLLVELLEKKAGVSAVSAIGHRVVHGGPRYRDPVRVDGAMLEELRRISSFAPNHLPDTIALMEVFAAKFPQAPQIACFDTAFHSTLPRVAKLLPIPRRYEAKGVQRYGFHGLSYSFLMRELEVVAGAKAASGRVILAHLGNGASMTAVRDGKSMDTSMGFTPAAGLVMSTRSGDLDPGLVAFLGRSEQMTETQFDRMIHDESGLLGVSEISSDMRDLLAREAADVRAAEAVALFCYQAKKWLGAFAAALGGLETLVFAGGIGENCPSIRARICEGLGFLGIELNEARNAENAPVISAQTGRVTVRIIRTDEELMIARSVCQILGLGAVNKTN